ncbi:MAG: hypothetical protein R3C20_03390 [Planctomycetaceae bacterium]
MEIAPRLLLFACIACLGGTILGRNLFTPESSQGPASPPPTSIPSTIADPPMFGDSGWDATAGKPPNQMENSGSVRMASHSRVHPTPMTTEDTAELRQLIDEFRVEGAEGTVWEEELTGVNLDDARFLLEQRNQMRSHAGLSSLKFLDHSVDELLDPQKTQPNTADSFSEAAMQRLRMNLAGAHIPGYRAATAFISTQNDPQSPANSLHLEVVTRFEPGKLCFTGRPLDIALPDDPTLWICLHACCQQSDNNVPCGNSSCGKRVFTRRGDMRILPNGEIGLQVGQSYFSAVATQNELPSSGDVRFQPDGTIVGGLAEKELQLGRLCVLQIHNPGRLSTKDGVLFSLPDSPSKESETEAMEPTQFELRVGYVELSNVSLSEDQDLFANVQRLLHPENQ